MMCTFCTIVFRGMPRNYQLLQAWKFYYSTTEVTYAGQVDIFISNLFFLPYYNYFHHTLTEVGQDQMF